MTDPKQIWLSPRCHDERNWCDDDPWEKCEECDAESVRYVLASDSDARIAELEAQNESLRRDAQRYQWLRSSFVRRPSHRLEWYLSRTEPLNAEGLDANIDAALAKPGSDNGEG